MPPYGDICMGCGKPIRCCLKCNLLEELFSRTSKSERDYYIMTELFVLLHGTDICDESEVESAIKDINENK